MSAAPEPHYFFGPHNPNPTGCQTPRPSQLGVGTTAANGSTVLVASQRPSAAQDSPLPSVNAAAASGSMCALATLGSGFSRGVSGGASAIAQNAGNEYPSFSSCSSEMPSMSFLSQAIPLHQPTAGDIFGLPPSTATSSGAAATGAPNATSVGAPGASAASLQAADTSFSFPTALVLQQHMANGSGATSTTTATSAAGLPVQTFLGSSMGALHPQQQQHVQQQLQPQYYFFPAGVAPIPGMLHASGLLPQHSVSPPQQASSVAGMGGHPTTFLSPSSVGTLFSPLASGTLPMPPTSSIFDVSLNNISLPSAAAAAALTSPSTAVAQSPTQPSARTGTSGTPAATNPSGTPEEAFNVLSEDKRVMLTIPVGLIEPTSGSSKYLQQGASACYTFRFQLCRSYRPHGRCAHRHQCAFIHSRHVVDPSLASCVAETLVHRNAPVAAGVAPPYPTHPAGVALQVYDSVEHKNLTVDSSFLYVTNGSQAALRAADKDASGQGINALASVRLQLCLHFDKGLCARGCTCNFVHKMTIEGDTAPIRATAPPLPDAASSTPSFTEAEASVLENDLSRNGGAATAGSTFPQPPLLRQQQPPPPPHQQFIPVTAQASGSSISSSSIQDGAYCFAPMGNQVISSVPGQVYFYSAPHPATMAGTATPGGSSAVGAVSPSGMSSTGGQWQPSYAAPAGAHLVHPGLYTQGGLLPHRSVTESGGAGIQPANATVLPLMYPATGPWGAPATMEASFSGITVGRDHPVMIATPSSISAQASGRPAALSTATQPTTNYAPVQGLYFGR